jgi:hypothetical protein
MRKINGLWHHRNPISSRPSRDERTRWHLAHSRACGCQPIPKFVAATLRELGVSIPARRA